MDLSEIKGEGKVQIKKKPIFNLRFGQCLLYRCEKPNETLFSKEWFEHEVSTLHLQSLGNQSFANSSFIIYHLSLL